MVLLSKPKNSPEPDSGTSDTEPDELAIDNETFVYGDHHTRDHWCPSVSMMTIDIVQHQQL